MAEGRIGGPSADDGATVHTLRRILNVFRNSPAPPPKLSDEELVDEVRRRSAEAPDRD
jgi:hypothetical protein